jgi:hypothetical protein
MFEVLISEEVQIYVFSEDVSDIGCRFREAGMFV